MKGIFFFNVEDFMSLSILINFILLIWRFLKVIWDVIDWLLYCFIDNWFWCIWIELFVLLDKFFGFYLCMVWVVNGGVIIIVGVGFGRSCFVINFNLLCIDWMVVMVLLYLLLKFLFEELKLLYVFVLGVWLWMLLFLMLFGLEGGYIKFFRFGLEFGYWLMEILLGKW